ncbi:MAG: energy-coupled thiamine transporter ThiT [Candidatus Bathyarchaeia archaeon]
MNQQKFETKILAEIIVVVALSGVLYSLRPFSMPFGGSVTLGSMVPVMWLALRRGVKIGVFAGVVFGLLALPIDVLMLPYSPIANPAQVFLDYPLAFAALGLIGFFKAKKEHPRDLVEVGVYALLSSLSFIGAIVHNIVWLVPAMVFFALSVWGVIERKAWQSPLVGVAVAGLGKFLAHFVSGVIFWSAYAPPELGPYLYSAVYNGSFLIPEFVISAFLVYLLVQRGTVEITV